MKKIQQSNTAPSVGNVSCNEPTVYHPSQLATKPIHYTGYTKVPCVITLQIHKPAISDVGMYEFSQLYMSHAYDLRCIISLL